MRVTTETFGGGDMSWLGSNHGTDNAGTCSLAVADFTAAEHYPNGYLPAGLPLNCNDLANAKPYSGAAGERLGFLLFNQPVPTGDPRVAVPVVWHGRIVVDRLPVDNFTPPTGPTNFEFDVAATAPAAPEGGAA